MDPIALVRDVIAAGFATREQAEAYRGWVRRGGFRVDVRTTGGAFSARVVSLHGKWASVVSDDLPLGCHETLVAGLRLA